MVELIFFLQTPEDRDRLFNRRLSNVDGLEPSLKGGVLLNIFPVFVKRGGADAAELAPCQRRLQHVRCVHGALRAPCADDRMELIDEEDHRARGLVDLLEHRLEPVLELAPVFCACEQCPKVKGKHPLVLQGLRYVAANDPLGEAFNDGRLPDARLADDDRVVLCPSGEHLHDPAHLFVAADDGVELPFPRLFRQVAAVPLERLVFLFRRLVGDALRPPDIFQYGIDAVLGDAVVFQYLRGIAFLDLGDADKEMLCAHIFVLQARCLFEGDINGALQRRRDIDLCEAFDAGLLLHLAVEVVKNGICVRAELIEQRLDHPFLLRYERVKKVFALYLLMAHGFGLFLSLGYGLLGLYGQFFPVHMSPRSI